MAAKSALNAKNLAALGAERLAELLIEFSETDAAAKRRLRIELAAKVDPDAVGREVRKRLNALSRARSFLDWRKTKILAQDLDTQRSAIVDQVAKANAGEAYDLMWRFLGLADAIYERCDDSNGEIGPVFADACEDLGTLADKAKPDRDALVERMFDALQDNGYGQYDRLIEVLASALQEDGLKLLKARFEKLAREPAPTPADDEREVIGWSSRGPIYKDAFHASARQSAISMAMKDIADALGDVDSYIAQYSEDAKKAPRVAAGLAKRLLGVGRATEALHLLEAADRDRAAWIDHEWEDVYIETLDALDRQDEAQALRWKSFCGSLSNARLKAYLERLPDFDDVEAEDRAIEVALVHPSVHQALSFLVSWPAHEKAASLIISRTGEIDGNHYYFLAPAAEQLAGKFPLAATLLLRAMIDFALDAARYKRYKYAANHLLECESLASQIDDFGDFETHVEYVTRLKAEHGRKSGFWSQIQ